MKRSRQRGALAAALTIAILGWTGAGVAAAAGDGTDTSKWDSAPATSKWDATPLTSKWD